MKRLILAFALACFATVGAAKEMVITTEVPDTHWKTGYVQRFAQLVSERSGGEIKVKFYPAGQLYSDRDGLAALGSDTVHMVWPISTHLESLDPGMGLLGLPFTLSDELMAKPGFARDLAAYLSEKVRDRNLAVLALMRATDAVLVMKSTPVSVVADLNGKRIRGPAGTQFRDMMRALSANPINLPASEMVTSLSQGVIDGVMTSPAGWRTILADSARNGTLVPGLLLTTYAVVVDRAWLDALDETSRTAVISSIEEIAASQWADAIRLDGDDTNAMVSSGASYVVVEGAAYDAFRGKLQPVKDAFGAANSETWQAYTALVEKYAAQ
ncbi:C4-dicarboxylate-binding protein DctP [Pseudochelatococcus lubricantis]|uniref:C4-dicarboxylate-binding protein DctP n=1 Tax=Pseudochelatococcus lubricantis TaxID=1538102 RepID=A0ABX0V2H9_9HYPH|nr:TRAP transporter substrate-binding protein DctP [Pseudochelatococcus lubricantis]NIJ59142.1 C4-dicarboxylate-binding protein DctP [Pseudochelatococcus lubricantis]